jgi:hypothetical protein
VSGNSYQPTLPIVPSIPARWPCGRGKGPHPAAWHGHCSSRHSLYPAGSPTASFDRRGGIIRPLGLLSHVAPPDRLSACVAANPIEVRAVPILSGFEVAAAFEDSTARETEPSGRSLISRRGRRRSASSRPLIDVDRWARPPLVPCRPGVCSRVPSEWAVRAGETWELLNSRK